MRNHLLSYDVLILETSFHDVWVKCNETLYWAPVDELYAVIPSFGKGGGSRNSYEMRLSGMPGMDLLISPSLQTYTANIGIWRGSISMYTSMFWSLWTVIPPLFDVGETLDSWCSHDLCRLKLKFLMKEWGQPQMMHLIKWMIPKVLG